MGNDYKTKDCSDIITYGIDSSLRGYIENATWYLYGSGTSQSKQNWYLCERGGNSCTTSGPNTGDASVTSKMGLMYISDYLYANGYYSSTDTSTQVSGYYGNENWLYKGEEWTQTPYASDANRVWSVTVGYVHYDRAYRSYGWRPTFYLKSSVYVTGGNGFFNNPYTLGCDNCTE